MKFFWCYLAIFGALTASNAAFAGVWIQAPTVDYNGVPHKVISHDLRTGLDTGSEFGLCRYLGYDKFLKAVIWSGELGPYLTLESDGSIRQVLPNPEQSGRFEVVMRIECQD